MPFVPDRFEALTSALISAGAEYSDLTIVCGSKAFRVHKVVVCTQCKPFATMMNGSWTESAAQVITLHDEDEEVVETAITYLYSAKLDEVTPEHEFHWHPMYLAKLYIFGDKWGLPAMQRHIVSVWKTQCRGDNWPGLNHGDEVLEVVGMIWHSILDVDDALKRELIELVRDRLTFFDEIPNFHNVLVEVPAFSSVLIKRLAAFERNGC